MQIIGRGERGAVPGEVVAVIVMRPSPVHEVGGGEQFEHLPQRSHGRGQVTDTEWLSVGPSTTRDAWARIGIASNASRAGRGTRA